MYVTVQCRYTCIINCIIIMCINVHVHVHVHLYLQYSTCIWTFTGDNILHVYMFKYDCNVHTVVQKQPVMQDTVR